MYPSSSRAKTTNIEARRPRKGTGVTGAGTQDFESDSGVERPASPESKQRLGEKA